MHIFVCTYLYIPTYNPLNPYNITHMYVFRIEHLVLNLCAFSYVTFLHVSFCLNVSHPYQVLKHMRAGNSVECICNYVHNLGYMEKQQKYIARTLE